MHAQEVFTMAHQRRAGQDVQQPLVDERRKEMRQAVAGAVVGVYRPSPPAPQLMLIADGGGGDPEAVRAAAAAYLQKPPNEMSEEEVQQVVGPIEEAAGASADRVGRWIDAYAGHLENIGCAPGEAARYFELERQTLASLYFVLREPVPSPTEVRRLALRLALDARRAIEGGLNRFALQRRPEGWRIVEYPSIAHAVVPLLPPGRERFVGVPSINAILDDVFAEPTATGPLLRVLETLLGGVPQASDTLEGAAQPRFDYEVCSDPPRPRVRLWLNGQEVALSRRADLHALLYHCCLRPTARFCGRRLQRNGAVRNASLAASLIRSALANVLPGAGEWLQSQPNFGWAAGRAPLPRPAASGNTDSA
jgi:hypothetical protein